MPSGCSCPRGDPAAAGAPASISSSASPMPGADAACSLLLALLLHSLHLRALCVSLDASVSVSFPLHFADEGGAHGDGFRSAAQRVRGTDAGEGFRGTIALQPTAQGLRGREVTQNRSEARVNITITGKGERAQDLMREFRWSRGPRWPSALCAPGPGPRRQVYNNVK